MTTEHDKYYKLWNSAVPYKAPQDPVPAQQPQQSTAWTAKSKPKLQNLASPVYPRNTKKRCGSCAVIMDIERFPVHQKQLNFGWCRSCCSSNISEPPMSSDDSLYDDYYDDQLDPHGSVPNAPIVYNDDDDDDDLSE